MGKRGGLLVARLVGKTGGLLVAFLEVLLVMGLAERVVVVKRVDKVMEALLVEVAVAADKLVAGRAGVLAASAVEWLVAKMAARSVVVSAAPTVAAEKMGVQKEGVAMVVGSRRCTSRHPLWLCCRN